MQQGDTSSIFPDIIHRIDATLLGPIDIQLKHHICWIGLRHQIVIDHLVAPFFELLAVVVKTKPHSAFFGFCTHPIEIVAIEFDLIERLTEGKPRLDDIGTSGFGLGVERLFPPLHHFGVLLFRIVSTHVCAHHLHAEVLTHFAEFGRCIAVQFSGVIPGCFEGLIPHFGRFFQCCRHIFLHRVTQRIELQPDDFVRSLTESSFGQQPASDHGTRSHQHGFFQKFSSVHNQVSCSVITVVLGLSGGS